MSDTNSGPPQPPLNHPDAAKWYHTRRETMKNTQRWMVLFTAFILVLAYFKPDSVKAATDLLMWFYIVFSIPTIGYYSNTAIDALVAKRV